MTPRQKILKLFYPFLRKAKSFISSKKSIVYNTARTAPRTSFYDLHAIANNGSSINFEQFKGKKVLLVNTASDCGYTGQYAQLEKLYKQYKHKLVILGFPANDFKEQEKGNDEQIKQFCKLNYGISFQLMKKSVVVKNQ